MIITVIAVCVATFLFGVVVGNLMHYYTQYRPLANRANQLLQTLVTMKKQGFVPQYEIEQPDTPDPGREIREY